MRILILALLLTTLTSCSVWNSIFTPKEAEVSTVEVPTDLPAPEYDPATSPVPMTQNTVLPKPSGAEQDQPAAYGSYPNQPSAYGSVPEDPAAYPPASTPLSAQTAKGGAAPAAYGNASATSYIDAMLSGLWENTVDSLEVIEFATDHYTTFYQGEMLLREPMTYHQQCPGDCNGGQTMEIACFTVSGPAGTDCYGIIRLTPEILELSLLGVSTETIVYRKR